MDWMKVMVVSAATLLIGCSSDASSDGSGDGTSSMTADGDWGGSMDGATSVADDGGGSGSGDGTGGVVGGCGSPGWTTTMMPWSQINAMTTASGGFSVCTPDAWMVSSDASNVIQLLREDPTDRILLAGVLDLDHPSAVLRLIQNFPDCDQDLQILEIGGWPAIQMQYIYDVPPCGECTDPMPAQAYGVYTHVAAGEFMASVRGDTDASADPAIVGEMIAIGRTVTTTGVGPAVPAETVAELAQLQTARDNACPP